MRILHKTDINQFERRVNFFLEWYLNYNIVSDGGDEKLTEMKTKRNFKFFERK